MRSVVNQASSAGEGWDVERRGASQGADGTNRERERGYTFKVLSLTSHPKRVEKAKVTIDSQMFIISFALPWLLYAGLLPNDEPTEDVAASFHVSQSNNTKKKKKKKGKKECPEDGLKVSESSLLALNAGFKIYRGLPSCSIPSFIRAVTGHWDV